MSQILAAFIRQLIIPPAELKAIAAAFCATIRQGLAGNPASLKMLPAFFGLPSGREAGEFLAVDFGGTNLRLARIELTGQRKIRIISSLTVPLQDPQHSYDYTAVGATARELFDFIAAQVARLVTAAEDLPLGHTFSFPSRQTAYNDAVLLHWTKEINTAGVEGRPVNRLLKDALIRAGRPRVVPAAIINDTVGTLLAAAYCRPGINIASICGTGHNTAYLEPCYPPTGKPMIINLEAGNFSAMPLTGLDRLLDRHSDQPGRQSMEKMVSGRYLGELLRLSILALARQNVLPDVPAGHPLTVPYRLTGRDVAVLAADNPPDWSAIGEWLAGYSLKSAFTLANRNVLHCIARLLLKRSARLAAAGFLGIRAHLDQYKNIPCRIALDGSLYEKAPGYANYLTAAFTEILTPPAICPTLNPTPNGSLIGAAVAAALASPRPR